jgi:sugar lactone lactonase YvrE
MKKYSAQEWLPSASGLGESPLYRASDKTFFFADIKNRLVHRVPESEGWEQRKTYEFDQPITSLEIVANRTDVLAVQTRLSLTLLSLQTGTLKKHHDPPAR